jgi:hypothetical protein
VTPLCNIAPPYGKRGRSLIHDENRNATLWKPYMASLDSGLHCNRACSAAFRCAYFIGPYLSHLKSVIALLWVSNANFIAMRVREPSMAEPVSKGPGDKKVNAHTTHGKSSRSPSKQATCLTHLRVWIAIHISNMYV